MLKISRFAYHKRIMAPYLAQRLSECFEESDIDSLFTIFYSDGSLVNYPGDIENYLACKFETDKYDSIGYEVNSGRTVVQKVEGSNKTLHQYRFDTFHNAILELLK